MKYSFKDILNEDMYNNTRVMVVVGKYNIFNNMVADTLKELCTVKHTINNIDLGLSDEFGVEDEEEQTTSNSVDLETFLDVANVSSINGRWFCRLGIESLNKKQKDAIFSYIKSPSRNAMLVLMSNDYREYKDFLNNKALLFGQYAHIMQLGFPNKVILKSIVKNMFEEKGIDIDSQAIDYFMMRLNTEYDEYDRIIDEISESHKDKSLDLPTIKGYLKGVEYFDIDDFMTELVKPLSSGKLTNKKIIRMLTALKDKYDSEYLVMEIQKRVQELIDYRLMINRGYISINIKYIFNDVVKLLGPDNKYSKVNEWVFRKKADLASMTSLEDWIYMNIMLNKALGTGFSGSKERKFACERVLYDIVTRSVVSEDRINNIVGIDNILTKTITKLDRIKYIEPSNIGG